MKSKSEPVKSTHGKRKLKAKVSDVMKNIKNNLQTIKDIQFCNVQIIENGQINQHHLSEVIRHV